MIGNIPIPPVMKVEPLEVYCCKALAMKDDPAALFALGMSLMAIACSKSTETMPDAKWMVRRCIPTLEDLVTVHWDTFKQAVL